MKKLTIITISFFIFNICYAYEWHPMSPSGIKANKLCVIGNNDYDVYAFITVDTGIYILSDFTSTTGDFFSLPIIDACPFDFGYPTVDSIIVLINEGSYSDGIYSFHLETHELQLIEFCYKPNFIEAWDYGSNFYVGFEGGLLTSEDGLNWEIDPTFDQMNCISLTQFTNNVEYIIVLTDNPTDNAFVMIDEGQDWLQVLSDFKIVEAFDKYGICRNEDDEYGGLYELYFPGLIYEWVKKSNSAFMNCIGGSNSGYAFVGWHSSEGDDEGVGEVKYSSFQFKNEGLPNLDINHITTDPGIIGGEVIFCCTDDGAFWLEDASTGIDDNTVNQEISIFPNPACSSSVVNISLPEDQEITQIQLFNIKGDLEFESKIDNTFSKQNFQIQLPDVSAGIYYCHLKTGQGNFIEKLVIR